MSLIPKHVALTFGKPGPMWRAARCAKKNSKNLYPKIRDKVGQPLLSLFSHNLHTFDPVTVFYVDTGRISNSYKKVNFKIFILENNELRFITKL